MRGGHVDAISRRTVAGWAADAERPGLRIGVSISVNGAHVADIKADRQRNDLATLGRYGDGRHGFSYSFTEPLDPAQTHIIVVSYTDDGAIVPNGRHTLKAAETAAAAVSETMIPILVTAPGRSGTTLLMSLLARSPHIIAAELVPYELRLLSYHAAAYHILSAPADLERSTHPDRLEGDGFHIGFNPFHSPQYAHAFKAAAPLRDYFDQFVPDQLLRSARAQIEEYYRRLARDRAKQAGFFAEKGNNLHKPTRQFTRRAFGAVRELVIVRDPRDVLCSHMAYFSSTAEKAFGHLSHAARQLLDIRDEGRPDIHILKYEDMVAGDPACFSAMSAFLGVAIEPDAGQGSQDVFRRHGTSVSPEASVARWRTNLPEALKARCASDWDEFLTVFGYELV